MRLDFSCSSFVILSDLSETSCYTQETQSSEQKYIVTAENSDRRVGERSEGKKREVMKRQERMER
jgi:hypothetical protein